jgi:endonuclease-3 related protein
MMANTLMEIYKLLFERFGPQHWWPGGTQFEIIVGAILTQNTNWSNVEKAIANLKAENLLTPTGIHTTEVEQLAEFVRPAGYYRVKAKRLKSFTDWLFDNYGGALGRLEQVGTEQLREELLNIKGVGPETADSILLYALNRPVVVVDAYTARIIGRHQLIEPGADYEQLREFFESNLPHDVRLYNEYHALLGRVGKEYCRPQARCTDCPLEPLAHSIESCGL